ncbi:MULTISPECIES: nif-specific transcriptional activator NifA [Rhizobium]|uniref:Nif-specific regulatory protein n=1 Tax=Rhizobium aouanii TaxID=3118145 RepID=A0ABU8CJ22_9HYPH|nr:nif-specific transcriptional activator NifA [Rhizobium acaciae]MCW1750284.1 nif-specific transcriptional activator NifA [Rhizobium acaciae]
MGHILRDRVNERGWSDSSIKPQADLSLSGIYQISKVLTAPTRLEITLANVANTLALLLDMRHGAIVVLERDEEPEFVVTAGVTRPPHSSNDRAIPQAVLDEIVATEAPVFIPDVSKSELFPADFETSSKSGAPPTSFIGVPLKAERKILGALSIYCVSDRRDDDLRFLTMVADLIGRTIWLHRTLELDSQQPAREQGNGEASPSAERRDTGRHLRARIGWLIGESPPVKQVLETVSAVATTNTTVLLRGESGTGKEFFAQAIHELSPRSKKPFVKLNCAALSEGVLESELFGHEKGAFTGAISQRAGRFELANGGTLLLDEIGEISAAFQAKLLRVLQEGELERVGGTKTLKVDVRLICATNRNLEAAVANGEFRADLYYRISVVPIVLPPLRERPGDIQRLARVFLDRFNTENGREHSFEPSALDVLSQCYFPGNVRELENCVRRTATLAHSRAIVASDFACKNSQCLSSLLWKGTDCSAGGNAIDELSRSSNIPSPLPLSGKPVRASQNDVSPAMGDPKDPTCPAMDSRLTERERLIDAMEKAGWVQAKAARILGLTPRQVGYALRRLGIAMKKF